MADEPNVNPVRDALAAHADGLVPGGVDSLAAMWDGELRNVPPGVRDEVIKARLQDPRYAGFKKPAGVAGPGGATPPAGPAGDKPQTVSEALLAHARDQQAAHGNPYSPVRPGGGRGGFGV